MLGLIAAVVVASSQELGLTKTIERNYFPLLDVAHAPATNGAFSVGIVSPVQGAAVTRFGDSLEVRVARNPSQNDQKGLRELLNDGHQAVMGNSMFLAVLPSGCKQQTQASRTELEDMLLQASTLAAHPLRMFQGTDVGMLPVESLNRVVIGLNSPLVAGLEMLAVDIGDVERKTDDVQSKADFRIIVRNVNGQTAATLDLGRWLNARTWFSAQGTVPVLRVTNAKLVGVNKLDNFPSPSGSPVEQLGDFKFRFCPQCIGAITFTVNIVGLIK